jgi:hypothetical protein
MPKNNFYRNMNQLGGFFTFQSNMWEMWKITLQKFKKQAEKDYNLNKDSLVVSIYTEKKRLNEKEMIEYLICECSSIDKDREKLCYDRLDDLNENIEKNYLKMKKENNIDIKKPNEMTRILFEKSKYMKEKIDAVIDRGLGKTRNKTVSDVMLELNIIVDKELINKLTI